VTVDIEMVDSLETVLSELVGDVVTPTGVSHLSEHIAERLAAAGWHLARPDSLDAAWAEAEAALPEGWFIVAMAHSPRNHRYEFRATHPRGETSHPVMDDQGKSHRGGPMWDSLFGAGLTPAAALHALVAKLREKSRSGLTTTATIPPM